MNLLAQITPDTQFALSLSAACFGVAAIVTAVWKVANRMRDVSEKLEQLTMAVQQCWTKHDQEKWAYKLERANRKNGLVVPSPVSESDHGL